MSLYDNPKLMNALLTETSELSEFFFLLIPQTALAW